MTQKATRRDFLKSTGLIGVSLLTTGLTAFGQEGTNSSSWTGANVSNEGVCRNAIANVELEDSE